MAQFNNAEIPAGSVAIFNTELAELLRKKTANNASLGVLASRCRHCHRKHFLSKALLPMRVLFACCARPWRVRHKSRRSSDCDFSESTGLGSNNLQRCIHSRHSNECRELFLDSVGKPSLMEQVLVVAVNQYGKTSDTATCRTNHLIQTNSAH